MIWHGAEQRLFRSNVFLYLATADSPAMAYLNGLVGHNGAHGCCIYCGQCSRHKPALPNYYPALHRYGPDDSGSNNYSLCNNDNSDNSDDHGSAAQGVVGAAASSSRGRWPRISTEERYQAALQNV